MDSFEDLPQGRKQKGQQKEIKTIGESSRAS